MNAPAHWHVWVRGGPNRRTFWQWLGAGGIPIAWERRSTAKTFGERFGLRNSVVAECRAEACAVKAPRPEAW